MKLEFSLIENDALGGLGSINPRPPLSIKVPYALFNPALVRLPQVSINPFSTAIR